MPQHGCFVVIGGTSGLGRAVAQAYADRGRDVVVLGRDPARAKSIAREIGGMTRGAAVDLARPDEIADRLTGIDTLQHLVLAAVERDENSVRHYDVQRAVRLATVKIVGYTEVVHALAPRMTEDAAVVLFGGLAKDRPYAGSTTLTTVNGAISALVRTLAVELAPVRVNAVHPGIVCDSPAWRDKLASVLGESSDLTLTKRPVRTEDVVSAVMFLLENTGVNGVNLDVDAGWSFL